MARIRTIKPEFFTDAVLVEVSMSARLLFIGTWVFADDFGNLERSAKQLKLRVFPADVLDVEPLIQELIAHRLLVEYSVSDRKYLHIPGFTRHQKIDRPSAPRCPLHESSTMTHRGLALEGKGKEGKGSVDDGFASWWAEYPKKVAKGDAEKAWLRIKPDAALIETMIAAVLRQRQSPQWTKDGDKFIPHPATWLNGRRWEDESSAQKRLDDGAL
ncbi:MAG: hypothetical protein ACRD0K_17780 [Egibacteraceae bacterium]